MAAIHCAVLAGDPALADEFISNGGFDSAADWTQTFAEWVISGGVATYTAGTGSNIRQLFTDPGSYDTFRITYAVNSVTGGGVYFTLTHGLGTTTGATRSAAGTYTEDINIGGTTLTQLRFNCTGTACAIDNVSMRRIL